MSDDKQLKRMRELRRRAEAMNRTCVEDHRRFLNPLDKMTFFRVPSQLPEPGRREPFEPNVTPTCTAFMALALTRNCKDFYRPGSTDDIPDILKSDLTDAQQADRVERGLSKEEVSKILSSAFKSVLDAKWQTARLESNNAFTTALVLRATGLLFREGFLSEDDRDKLRRNQPDRERNDKEEGGHREIDKSAWPHRCFSGLPIRKIAQLVAKHVPKSLSVQKYPPAATLGYWLLDAVALLGVDLSKGASERVIDWAARDFVRQVSLVCSNDPARMDPIAMVMAACLCRLLRRIVRTCCGVRREFAAAWSPEASMPAGFPTLTELRWAVNAFLGKQNRAGVWEKYFPLFHYPGAGPNHCWHFEVLEAILHEFPEIVREESTIRKIERSLDWLDANRVRWRSESNESNGEFVGWNSGGDIPRLQTGEPESWPTGVVHMFLWRLRRALSLQIRELLLQKYRDRVQRFTEPNREDWENYLDCDLPPLAPPRNTVKRLLEEDILEPAHDAVSRYRKQSEATEVEVIGPDFKLGKSDRRSALLFGPPGTSKTSLAEAVAKWLGWPFLELTPSDFLKGGMQGIYDRVNEVFVDLMDLSGVVILFDEMDALVQSREEAGDGIAQRRAGSVQLDVTQQFLTTSMLPKLLKLRKEGRVIFFMATNHQRDFDPAIKRPGRFDLLIRMGPPTYHEKLRCLKELDHWYRGDESQEDRETIQQIFQEWTKPKPIRDAIGLFTYHEMDAFFESIRIGDEVKENLRTGLQKIGEERFHDLVMDWAQKRITLRPGPTLEEFIADEKEIRRQ